MCTRVEHPLAVYLAAPAVSQSGAEETPAYNPATQLQVQWTNIANHMEILMSGEKTGDPDTMSSTTAPADRRYPGDADTDDSGT
jgi:hypothetical protein